MTHPWPRPVPARTRQNFPLPTLAAGFFSCHGHTTEQLILYFKTTEPSCRNQSNTSLGTFKVLEITDAGTLRHDALFDKMTYILLRSYTDVLRITALTSHAQQWNGSVSLCASQPPNPFHIFFFHAE